MKTFSFPGFILSKQGIGVNWCPLCFFAYNYPIFENAPGIKQPPIKLQVMYSEY